MKLLSVRQAAERLSVSRNTVYNLCDSGDLRCYRIGVGRGSIRVSEEHLEEYLRRNETKKGEEKLPTLPPAPKPVKLRHLQL